MVISRRGFLHALGIGGIALTLPKPLEILKGVDHPPVHAGRLLFPPLADDITAFEMFNLSICPKQRISIAAFNEFFEKWLLKVSLLKQGVEHDLMHTPAPLVTHAPGNYPNTSVSSPNSILFTPDMRMDCWLRPDGRLKYPMPEVDMILNGRILRKGQSKPMSYMMFGKFKTIRVDLEKAKKLGLVPASEQEDTFESERPEELASSGNLFAL